MLHFISVALHMSAFHLTFNFCAFHFAKGHINSCPLDQSPIEQKVEKPEELLRCTGHSLDDIPSKISHRLEVKREFGDTHTQMIFC